MFAKFDDIWYSHKLPEIQIAAGKIIKGQQFVVFPPLVRALMKIGLDTIFITPGRLGVCIPMERDWGRTWAEIGLVLAHPNILSLNGAISATRKTNVRTLWVNHRLPRKVWYRSDLDDYFKLAFMPLLVRELLRCHNVHKLIVFRKQYSGISVIQKHFLPWHLTEQEMLAVLKQPWINRHIHEVLH